MFFTCSPECIFLICFSIFNINLILCRVRQVGDDNSAPDDPKVTDIVFFDISMNGQEAGRLEIGLFGEIVPKTVKNFVELAKRKPGEGYSGSKFHRVIEGFLIQGGDFINGDGTGGTSIYGGNFEDENFKLKHLGGWVSMANAGKDANGSQFLITARAAPELDGKHVVFGKIIKGMFLIHTIQATIVDDQYRPKHGVVIYKSGVLPVKKPFSVKQKDASWFEVNMSYINASSTEYVL